MKHNKAKYLTEVLMICALGLIAGHFLARILMIFFTTPSEFYYFPNNLILVALSVIGGYVAWKSGVKLNNLLGRRR